MSNETTVNNCLRAACLTPPSIGGVAVIQVIGREAAEAIGSLFKSSREMDWERMAGGELCLCRIIDGDQVVDDALVSLRFSRGGEEVIDISIHGGPWVVQRVLILLKRWGVIIVEAKDLLERSWAARNTIEVEMLELLLRSKTRMAATWLVGMADVLGVELERIMREIEKGAFHVAITSLESLCCGADKIPFLIDGVRVVLMGQPNTGKSTLANALADREHAVVSEVPGTTRDWVEHPGSIKGIPFIFVDTAGLRVSSDPVETEAVRRAHDQMGRADVLLWVIDSSVSPAPADKEAVGKKVFGEGKAFAGEVIYVWNKSDLAVDPHHRDLMGEAGPRGLVVSGLKGSGIDRLGELLCELVGLAKFDNSRARLFTGRQLDRCKKALSALSGCAPDGREAINWLKFIIDKGYIAPEFRH